MIFFLLLQTFLSEPTLYKSAVQDLASVDYDSIHITTNYQKLSTGSWVKTKPFRAGNNLVKIKVGNRFKLVPVRIQLFKNVWKVKKYVKKSSVIPKTLLVNEYADISYINRPITDIKSVLIAAKSLKSGTVLTQQNIRKEYDCKFGESVSLEYKLNSLKISVAAKSLVDAYVGEKISVQTELGKISGVLISKGIVRYEKF